MNHAHDCAFAMSFGDLPCDCDGPNPTPAEPGAASAIAREHLAKARAALGRSKP